MRKATAMGWLLHALVGCSTTSNQPNPQESVPRGSSEERSAIIIRELRNDGSVALRTLNREALSKEQETRVFQLKHLFPPAIDPVNPRENIEDWEPFGLVESLMTHDIRWRTVGRVQFDRNTNRFIVRDSLHVLDRVEEALKGIEPASDSSRLQKMLEAREAAEAEEMALKLGRPLPKPRERGHLMIGRIPALLRNVRDAVASLGPEQSAEEVLREPLLDLRNEIDRIYGVPRPPREY